MNKTQDKKENKSRISPKRLILLIISIVLFSFLLSSVFGLFNKYLEMRDHISSLKNQEAELLAKKELTSMSDSGLDTDFGKEQIFREKYRMTKPGEGLIIITKQKEIPTTEAKRETWLALFWKSISSRFGW
jgi:cell division protein FtsB